MDGTVATTAALAYQALLLNQTSASIARASLSDIEDAVATMIDTSDSLLVHRVAVGVERLAFDELERQWVDYGDIRDQYLLP